MANYLTGKSQYAKSNPNYKHGATNHSLYDIWIHIRMRCTKKSDSDYKLYGKRGITLCNEWLNPHNFFADMGKRPSSKHSVERRNNNKGYTKNNCYWATNKEQANNKRTCVYIPYNGKTQTLKQWSEELGIKYMTLYNRINKSNMDIPTAFTKPIGRWT